MIALGLTLAVVLFSGVYTYRLRAQAQKLPQLPGSSASLPQNENTPNLPISESLIQSQTQSSSEEEAELEPFGSKAVNLLLVGIDATEHLTDVLMLARINLDEKTVNVLQIPRDSFIGDEVPTGKINTLYGRQDGGIPKLRSTIEGITALRVDYYAAITLEGLRKVIDNLGGVEVDIPVRIDYLPGKVLEPGLQQIDGEKAEWIVRYRAGYASGDLGRINTQSVLIKALIHKIKDEGRLAAMRAVAQNYRYVSTDLPASKLISLASEAYSIEKDNIEFFTAPGYGVYHNSYAVYGLNRANLADILNQHFRSSKGQIAASKLKIAIPNPD